ncbi:MAG: hypothetical protein IKU25_07360 [Clostridia bacterium]|nr:hypothetical protein [Clostridia bacterium]
MKKILYAIISVILILLVLTACGEGENSQTTTIENTTTTTQTTTQPKKELYVAFQKGEFVEKLNLDDVEFVKAEDFTDYRSEFAKYSLDIYYNALDDMSRLAYNILEYAFDNCYTNIIFDERVTNSYYLPKVLNGFARDSALIEQNILIYTQSDYQNIGQGMDRSNYIHVYIESFSEDSYSKKMKAVEKAESIISNMSSELTDLEKAKYFYKYLGKNVTYGRYDNIMEANYLYDALCNGKTQCDGFANAYSMLCNMAGVPCFERVTIGNEEEGHTWNTVCIDGKWYNVDVTGARSAVTKNFPVWLTFGFSDELQPSTGSVYGLPKCPDNLYEIDCNLENVNASNITQTLKDAFNKTTKKYIIIRVDGEIDEKNDPIFAAARYVNNVKGAYFYKLGTVYTPIYMYVVYK